MSTPWFQKKVNKKSSFLLSSSLLMILSKNKNLMTKLIEGGVVFLGMKKLWKN